MITFSTEFPVNADSVDAVLELGKTWILGSPHTKLQPSDLNAKVSSGDHFKCAQGAERVEMAHAQGPEYVLGGVRYSRVEKSELEWITTIVAARHDSQLLISLQISCESLRTITRLPKANKPYIIKQVLGSLGGGMDGEIPVTDQPFRLAAGEVEIAADLINGRGGNALPLVYVSSAVDGNHVVDVAELARWLAGMAHVVVEPNRSFSTRLKDKVGGRNVYGGTIGVYWPASYSRKAYFRDNGAPAKHLQVEIARDIRSALANRRQTSHCTWLHLMDLLAAQRLERIRRSGSVELDEFIEAADAEIRAKEDRIAEAQAEIARLNSELSRYGCAPQSTGGLLQSGGEQDYYHGEIRNTVISALEHYGSQVLEGTRRQHILSDLLEHNKKTSDAEKIEDEVKAIFRSFTDMDAKTRARLAKLGFELSEDGKHFKAVYQGDGRYTFAIAKTGSDHRGGKNLASDILKTIL